MAEIMHQVGVKADLEKVYQAISTPAGVSNWWTKTEGEAQKGGRIDFFFGDEASPQVEVVALEPNQLVVWKVSVGPDEWIGTEIQFRLEKDEDQVMVNFRHAGWKDSSGLLSLCSMKWAVFMLSLKEYLETGRGRPFPNDVQINHY